MALLSTSMLWFLSYILALGADSPSIGFSTTSANALRYLSLSSTCNLNNRKEITVKSKIIRTIKNMHLFSIMSFKYLVLFLLFFLAIKTILSNFLLQKPVVLPQKQNDSVIFFNYLQFGTGKYNTFLLITNILIIIYIIIIVNIISYICLNIRLHTHISFKN